MAASEWDDRRILQPHASRVLGAGEIDGVRSHVWMGGAHSGLGEPISGEMLARSWVLDCAGYMPEAHRGAAARWEAQVFADVTRRPEQFELLRSLTKDWARQIMDPREEAPEHVLVMCQYGMNRSGLGAGLLLSALGLAPGEAVQRITRARPGALANYRFRQLLSEAGFARR